MLDAGEGSIDFRHGAVGMAAAVALDEADLVAEPLAVDVDRVVEPGWPDLRQEARLQDLGDEVSIGFRVWVLRSFVCTRWG